MEILSRLSMIFPDVVEQMVSISYYLLKLSTTPNTESPDGKGLNKSRATSCHGPWGKGVDLIGSGWAGLLTSWHPKHVLQNLSVPLSIPGHNLFFILTIPGCPSCASVRTRGLRLLGYTILMPRSISLPITHSSLASDMYCLSWPSLQVPLFIR